MKLSSKPRNGPKVDSHQPERRTKPPRGGHGCKNYEMFMLKSSRTDNANGYDDGWLVGSVPLRGLEKTCGAAAAAADARQKGGEVQGKTRTICHGCNYSVKLASRCLSAQPPLLQKSQQARWGTLTSR